MIPLRLYLIAAAALLLLAGGTAAWVHYDNLVTERARFKAQAAQEKQAKEEALAQADKVRADAQAADKLLAKRTRERNAAQQSLGKLRDDIQTLKQDPKVAKWADAPLPDAAVGLLCQHGACAQGNGAGQGARKPDGTNAGAGLGAVPNELGVTPIRYRSAQGARASER